jgi:hypothetical protein
MASLRERPRARAACSVSTSLRSVAARSGWRKISPGAGPSRVPRASAATRSCAGVGPDGVADDAAAASSGASPCSCTRKSFREYGQRRSFSLFDSIVFAACASMA